MSSRSEKSGASGQQFAELVGVKYQTFATWVQQRKRQRAAKGKTPKSTAKVRWLEAGGDHWEDNRHDGVATLPVQLPGGARLEVSCSQQLNMGIATYAN